MADLFFPEGANLSNGRDNMAIQLFGNRIYSDQSLYEYLIEFMLVFVSAKNEDKKTGTMSFHRLDKLIGDELVYYVQPRMGLKRFIFYERAKKDVKISADEEAYKDIVKILKENLGDRNSGENDSISWVEAIQDLLYGYAAVIKKRSWTAQSLLPIAPELIFCEAMLNAKERLKLSLENSTDIEKKFDFDRHNFMARGGEVYYLHILQALELCTDDERKRLQNLLKHLVTAHSKQFSSIAKWVEKSWVENKNIDIEKLVVKKTLGFIPATGYIKCGKNTVTELINFLSNEMHPITRLELLSQGLVLQIMRMMCVRTNEYLGIEQVPWIVDMCPNKHPSNLRKLSANCFKRVEELFVVAINKKTSEYLSQSSNPKAKTRFDYLAEAKKHTLNMFKRLGKELKCVIPLKGGYERFSLSEDLVKFLVLCLVKPQEKMTFDMLLDKLYKHFFIVIGPKQYKQCTDYEEMDLEQANSFMYNELEFQNFLKKTGFLKELSDATSIVINPYSEVEL